MAEDKKSFLMYADWIHTVKKLPKKDAGELFMHLLEYVNDLHPTTDNLLVEVSFEPFKQQLKRDLEKWDKIREKRSFAGKKSAEKRKEKKQHVSTHVKSVQQKSTHSTVTVNDNVNVNGNVIVKEYNNKDNILLCSLSMKDERLSKYHLITLSFYKLFKENLLESGIAKTTTLDKAKLSTWSTHIKHLYEIDKRTADEVKEVFKFLQENEFWKKNIQSTKKLREQFEKLYLELSKNNPTQKLEEHEIQNDIRREFENEGIIGKQKDS